MVHLAQYPLSSGANGRCCSGRAQESYAGPEWTFVVHSCHAPPVSTLGQRDYLTY